MPATHSLLIRWRCARRAQHHADRRPGAGQRAYLEQALLDVVEGRINPGRLFDTTMSLDQVAEAYAQMDNRTALKVMLKP